MQKYSDVILDRKGNVVTTATVLVKALGASEPASIYSANTVAQPQVNPIAVDKLGGFSFYAANGRYSLEVYIGQALFAVSSDILLEDPSDATPEVIDGGVFKNGALENVTIDGEHPLTGAFISGPDGATKMGAGVRTQAEKNADLLSVRDKITTAIDGVTSNHDGIVAAVAEAYALNEDLFWPRGTYVKDADKSIPNFHKVTHYGPGVLKSGTTTYVIQPKGKSTVTNRLFVALSGAAGNDGLTADFPISTLQGALDALVNAGDFLCGRWRVELAEGNYVQSGTLDSIGFRNRLVVTGPEASGGVPTAKIDGTGISSTYLSGLTLSGGVFAQVKDIMFSNWTGASGVGSGGANTGLTIVDRANVWSDNCDYVNCDTGFGATNSRVYQGRGRVTGCAIGSTTFASAQCSYGYGGATTYTDCTIGVNARDSSSGVVDAGVFTNCNIGVRTQYGTVLRISNCAFSGSITADVYGYEGGSVYFGEGNTHTPGKKFRGQFALDLGSASQIYFDGDAGTTGRFNFGGAITPNYKFHFREEVQNAFASTAALVAIESPNPQIALNGSATAFAGIQVAVPTLTQAASFLYSNADGNWRVRCNNTDAYRMHPTTFRPAVDGVPSLGLPSAMFTVLYAKTGTINTSDERAKQQIKPVDEACLAAWAKVNYVQYKFNDAVAEKGDGARWHFGVIAQRVKQVFEDAGLDADEYGLLCYDRWPEQPEERDEHGNIVHAYRPAGDRYGIRYEEANSLEAACERWQREKLEAIVADLAGQIAELKARMV